MNAFLRSTPIIDWTHPDVTALAGALRGGDSDPALVAHRCFEWVRDHIKHSQDYQLSPVTCAASEVLRVGSGLCYAKSHLFAALLRGNRADIDAQFDPPVEQLAFAISLPGEADLPGIWPDALPVVVDALHAHTDAGRLGEELPDLVLWTAKR